MADRNVKWGGMDIAYVFFLQKSLDPKMKKLANNFIAGTEQYLTLRAATGDMGFVIERMQNGKDCDSKKPDGIFKQVHHQQTITLHCIYGVIIQGDNIQELKK
jgi:hypothetical protein